MRNAFLTALECQPLPDGVNWILTKPLKYVDPWGELITVDAGFKTDFASVPDLSRIGAIVLAICLPIGSHFSPIFYIPAFLAWIVCLIAESFLHEGTWDWQAANHDWMFRTRCRSFWRANWILFVSMKARGAPQTPDWKRVLIFIGVALGGYWAWISDGRGLRRQG